MRKVLIIALVILIAIVSVIPVMAAPPCEDAGGPGHSDYAQGHIVPLAQNGALGAGGHIPGSHQGYSLCNPSGK